MPERLLLADADTARDLLTFAGRAARAGAEGVRLQASGGVLRVSAALLAPQGLLDATPLVLGMRVVSADPELVCDVIVAPERLTAAENDGAALELPATAMQPAWAGISPPQLGWRQLGTVDATLLAAVAAAGVAQVSEGLPTQPGEELVRSVRAGVWGMPTPSLYDAPAGVAFAADALGFLRDDATVPIFECGRWLRLSTHRGHVLSRGPAARGLTPVRATGTHAH